MRSELEQAVDLLRRPGAENVQAALRLIQGTVFSFSMKLCGHREDAEDTMQEVLISSLRHLAKIENPRALSVWLYTAARNRCWRNRGGAVDRRTVSLGDLADTDLGGLLAESGTSPEQQASQRENEHLIRRALLRLPPQYRIVLALHDLEELDAGRIAVALSLEPGTVRVRLHRARLLLRKEVEATLQLSSGRKGLRALAGRPSKECGDLLKYLGSAIETQGCEQIQAHLEACPQGAAFIHDLNLAMGRCRSLKVPACESVGLSLQRLLVEEYRRLLAGSPSLVSAGLAS